MFFLRQSYKQKPKQWGPFSAVQSALFHNAEKIGINPASIVFAAPFWELSGSKIHNIAADTRLVVSGSSSVWAGLGLDCKASNSNYIQTTITDASLGEHTVIVVGEKRSTATSKYIIDSTNGSSGFAIRIGASGNIEYFAYASGGAGLCGTIAIGKNESFNAICHHDKSDGNTLFNNGKLIAISAVTGELNQLGTEVIIGADYAFSNNSDILFKQVIITDNVLKNSQTSELSDNPYQLWQQVLQKTIFVPLAGTGETITINKGQITLTGQDVNVNASEVISIGKGAITVTGKAITLGETISIGKGALTLTGKTIKLNEIIPINKGEITLTRKSINLTIGEIIEISKGLFTITGQDTYLNETIIIENANITITGKTVTIIGDSDGEGRGLSKFGGNMSMN